MLIQLINHSTGFSNIELAEVAAALNVQISQHFQPIWGTGATVVTSLPKSPIGNVWQLVVLDDSDQAGALGYHDLTAAGQPLGKVFAKTTHDAGLKVSVTISHEVLEMLADPDCNLCAEVDQQDGTPKTFYGYEVCDPCEDDSYGYLVAGVLLSDFVTPAWFQPSLKQAYDFCHHINAPLQILPGGYTSVLDVSKSGVQWSQVQMMKQGFASFPNVRSDDRLRKRRLGRPQFVRSTAGAL